MNETTHTIDQQAAETIQQRATAAKRPYQAPQIMVMDDKEVLKVFQITSAGISWWG